MARLRCGVSPDPAQRQDKTGREHQVRTAQGGRAEIRTFAWACRTRAAVPSLVFHIGRLRDRSPPPRLRPSKLQNLSLCIRGEGEKEIGQAGHAIGPPDQIDGRLDFIDPPPNLEALLVGETNLGGLEDLVGIPGQSRGPPRPRAGRAAGFAGDRPIPRRPARLPRPIPRWPVRLPRPLPRCLTRRRRTLRPSPIGRSTRRKGTSTWPSSTGPPGRTR